MEKQISIVVAASGEIKDIAISTGATVREVLNEAGLQGYQLSRKGGEPLDPDTDLFAETSDSEKLYATPEDVSVGYGGSASAQISSLKKRITSFIKTKFPHLLEAVHCSVKKGVRIIGCRPFSFCFQTKKALFIGSRKILKKKSTIIGLDREYPYWKEYGWRKNRNSYRGYYKTDSGNWRGLINENFKGNYSFFIFNPPKKLRNSEHWQCFTNKGNGKYAIHFSHKPKDISSGIMTVEQLLKESFERIITGGERCFSERHQIKEYILSQLRKI